MSFIGTVGVVAQQGNQGGFSAPAQTIATSSSGDYNMACLVHPTSNVHPNHNVWSGGTLEGDEFSQTGAREATADVNWSTGSLQLFTGGSYGAIQLYNGGYARHSLSSPTYTWSITNLSSSLSNGVTATLNSSATYKTVQDCTGINDSAASKGITTDDQIALTFGGGRGGLTYPAPGDTIEWKVHLEVDDQTQYFDCVINITWTV